VSGLAPAERTLVVGCAALVRELRSALDGLPVDVVLLPAGLHNRPERIPAAVDEALVRHGVAGRRAVVAYADCGTGGQLEPVLERHGARRLAGAHCYEVIASPAVFAALAEEEPGTFYLTEFLARAFDALVVGGLGLDRHPELRDAYFAHYRRVVLVVPVATDDLVALGRRAAERLGLAFEVREVGDAPFRQALLPLVGEGVA
jgi:hypothetical protein